jgi:DNA-binding PadR family transcriptional regulator
MTNLNSTAAALLGLLHGKEASGYELWNAAREFIGDFWTVTRSQVYRELTALDGHGLIEAQAVGPRSRRAYRITQEGRAAFADWLAQPPGPEQIRYPLLLTLAFGAELDTDTLLGFIDSHRPMHEQRLAAYRELATSGGLDRYQRATLGFGLHYEQAVLAWMDGLPALLTEAVQ